MMCQTLYALHPHRQILHPRHLINQKLHRNNHLIHLCHHQCYHHLGLLLQREGQQLPPLPLFNPQLQLLLHQRLLRCLSPSPNRLQVLR